MARPDLPYQPLDADSILLGTDVARFEVGGVAVEAPCKISFSVRRDSNLLVTLESDRELGILSFDAQVTLLNRRANFHALGSMTYVSSGGPFPIQLCPNPDVVESGGARPITHLSWIVYNGPDLLENNRRNCVDLEALGWKVAVRPRRQLAIYGPIQTPVQRVTHEVDLWRADLSTFAPKDGLEIAKQVRDFLSFVAGRWTGLALVVGADETGAITFEHWTTYHIDPPNSCIYHWYERGASLGSLFPGFMGRLASPVWREPFLDILYWYFISNSGGARCEGGVVVGQAALELASWTLLVLDKQYVSRTEFKKQWTAVQKIDELLEELQIPESLPNHLTAVRAAYPCQTGPGVIAKVRNDLVHPEKRGPEGLAWETWLLLMKYLDLVILRLSDYDGRYCDRTVLPRYSVAVHAVPWATPSKP